MRNLLRKLQNSKRFTSTTVAAHNPLAEPKVAVNDLTNFEKRIIKWFSGGAQINSATQIPLKMLVRAKSKFWITINVGTIFVTSALIGGSIYRFRSRPGV